MAIKGSIFGSATRRRGGGRRKEEEGDVFGTRDVRKINGTEERYRRQQCPSWVDNEGRGAGASQARECGGGMPGVGGGCKRDV